MIDATTNLGKPPSNTAGVKSFTKLSKTFDAIEIAGKQGDVTKAKNSWLITSELLSQYLADVELPSDINDPLYQPWNVVLKHSNFNSKWTSLR